MDFEQTRALLLATNDKQVGKLVGLLEKVFRPVRFRPNAGILTRERTVIDEAKAVFPAPFAIKFSFWADKLSAELNDAAAALRHGSILLRGSVSRQGGDNSLLRNPKTQREFLTR